MTDFELAQQYVSVDPSLKISDGIKLQFYAFFKQARVGPCNTERPSFFDFVGKAKWDAWNELGNMPASEAEQKYVDVLTQVNPDWRAKAAQLFGSASNGSSGADSADSSASSASSAVGIGGGGGGSGASMGRFTSAFAYDEAEMSVSESEQNIFYFAGQGDQAKVAALLAAGTSVNAQDEAGRTALHWAVDREQLDVAEQLLLTFKADANIQDGEGQTPLHYACLCEHVALARLLLSHGARTDLADSDGATPAQLAEEGSDPALKVCFQ